MSQLMISQWIETRTEINQQTTITFPLILWQRHYARQIVLMM